MTYIIAFDSAYGFLYIVAFKAEPFYDTKPLQFRGIPDSLAKFHLEGSECCLIHADNPLTATNGVWLNPNVRVGYTQVAYEAIHSNPNWPAAVDSVWGIWMNRIRRWSTSTFFKQRRVTSLLRRWKRQNPQAQDEPGLQCLINEMQVLVKNGWAHV